MRKLKLYLDTSVWSFYYAEDVPDRMNVTRHFLETRDDLNYEFHIAAPVLEEIAAAPDPVRGKLVNLIREFNPMRLTINREVQDLALAYLHHEVLPRRSHVDALHVACATVYGMDAVVSWNMRHIASMRRQEKVQAINQLQGYRSRINLISPYEVSENVEDKDQS